LKNVIIQEAEDFVPVSSYTSISVDMSAVTHATLMSAISTEELIDEPTKEMLEGVLPKHFQDKMTNAAGVAGAVILLHGYCSGSNPFAANPGDWTNAYYFLRASSTDTHDSFAKYVLAFAESNGIDSFSLVGHSQGGSVSAHIKNFYFSGLDLVGSGRLIQSIGTPYEGCSAAGSAANLGSIFGVGCGTNFDLSVDGSKLWEPTITTATRKQIYYYTTTYQQGNLFGDSCSMAMNMILEWPNDGTAEIVYTDIKNANNMGNTQKQCHTTDMNYPPQYYDNARNKQMNAAAAR